MARTEPGYDYFPQGRPGQAADSPVAGRLPSQRTRPLQSLAPEDYGPDAPFVPAGRLSAPPPNLPPVFERPVQPRGDQRPWGSAGQGRAAAPPVSVPPPSVSPALVPGRPVPAFTAHAVAPSSGHPAPTTAQGATWRAPSPRPLPAAQQDVALGRRARRRPGRVAVASVLAALLAGAVGYGAVVGVPRYLEHEDRVVWERTSVHVPRTVAGMTRITTASATAQAKAAQTGLLGSGAGQMITDLAVYGGRAGTRVVVVVGRPQHPLEADERELVLAGFARAVGASGVVLTERDPGELGGWFGCGVHNGRTTMCLAVDAGAVVSVTVTATGGSALTLAREARAAVERRATE
ncbi:hypothetical protein [Kineosporia sp. A_224]|uniref:hypothetical protein n=1 Tax=Kineosporia sp. A_224 TaxID=1962180 RepID=UPI000B4B9768|nr:hypothetical protein [Kineosporia sp. A_224]